LRPTWPSCRDFCVRKASEAVLAFLPGRSTGAVPAAVMPRRRCNFPRGWLGGKEGNVIRAALDAPQHHNSVYRHARRYGRRWRRRADAYQSKPAGAVAAAAARSQARYELAGEVVQRVWRGLRQYSGHRCLRQSWRLGDGRRFGQSGSLIGRVYRAGAVPAAVIGVLPIAQIGGRPVEPAVLAVLLGFLIGASQWRSFIILCCDNAGSPFSAALVGREQLDFVSAH
jgi:hypothetical protein